MKAVVFTLGCKVNECESDSLICGLKEKGFTVSDKLEYADLYIVNTCAVTNEAEKKSRQTFSRIKRLNPNAKIIYTGCASQFCPEAFADKENTVCVTGTFSKDKILSVLNDNGIFVFDEPKEFEEMHTPLTLRSRHFIKVQDGCNNFCSYCLIPYVRGRSRSRDYKKIIKEILELKPKEAVINGINLSAYNFEGVDLTGLVKELSVVDARIRLGSLEVNVITEEFLTALKGLKNFAPHFHLSLQSGSNKVLKDMNRHYTREEFLSKVELIRKFFPLSAITTDIIVGYPTESQGDFEDTLDLARKCAFADIHAFPFSKRAGTRASKLKDLDKSVKKERLNILLQEKAKLKDEFLQKFIGKELDFLFEEFADGYYQGYSENYIRVYLEEFDNSDNVSKVMVKERFLDGVKAVCK